MKRSVLLAACVALALVMTGCAGYTSPKTSASVSGTVRSLYGDAYPIGSVLVIRIVDPVSSVGVPVAETSQSVVPGWEVAGMNRMLDFTVSYDPTHIDPTRPYVVTAEVLGADGQPIAVSREPGRVITAGEPTQGVQLSLVSPNEMEPPAKESSATTPSAP